MKVLQSPHTASHGTQPMIQQKNITAVSNTSVRCTDGLSRPGAASQASRYRLSATLRPRRMDRGAVTLLPNPEDFKGNSSQTGALSCNYEASSVVDGLGFGIQGLALLLQTAAFVCLLAPRR